MLTRWCWACRGMNGLIGEGAQIKLRPGVQFQAGLFRGSLTGQLSSQCVRYHGAGLNGSCAALGAT